MRPEPVPFDRIAGRYDETRGGTQRGEINAAALAPWLVPAGPVVEVGVGTGLVAAALRQQGRHDVVGVDLSLPMLAAARQRLGPRVVAGDALRLPLRDCSVANVYFVHVLHLVTDIGRALTEARRVLTRSGRLLAVCASDEPPGDDVDEIVEDLHQAVRGPRPDEPARVAASATRAGLVLEHRAPLAIPARVSPEECARAIEDRVWAWTWPLDDETWRLHVVPALARLRSLPGPERPRDTAGHRTVFVFSPAP